MIFCVCVSVYIESAEAAINCELDEDDDDRQHRNSGVPEGQEHSHHWIHRLLSKE